MVRPHTRFYIGCLLALVVIATGASAADAQATATPTANSTPTTDPSRLDANGTMVGSVGPAVDVLDYKYQDGTMTLLLESSTITSVTLAQQIEEPDSGAQSFNIRSITVSPGQTRVKIDARHVAVTTPASVEAGRGLVVSAGSTGANPFSRLTPTTALLLGGSIVLVWMIFGGVLTVRSEGDAPVKADA
jgi:hypothetical protein